MRTAMLAAATSLILITGVAYGAARADIFAGDSVVEVGLDAPFDQLFARSEADPEFEVKGRLTYRDGSSGRTVVLEGVSVSTRGHTSRRASECDFPKLKVDLSGTARSDTPFEGIDAVKLGTHCGDRPDNELTPKYGRLANERAPQREAMVYRMLDAAGVHTLLARVARVTYVFSDNPGREPLTRLAMLLEDDHEARARVGGTGEIKEDAFGSAREQFEPRDTARLAFGEAMIGLTNPAGR